MVVVDIGCGSWCRGDIGIDLNPFSGKKSPHLDRFVGYTRNPECMLVVADAHMLPLRSGIADVVLMIHILEHLECPPCALREVVRVLKRGGRLIVEVPNPCKNRADWIDHTHLHSYTEASLSNVLRYVGLDVEVVIYAHYSDDIQTRAIKR